MEYTLLKVKRSGIVAPSMRYASATVLVMPKQHHAPLCLVMHANDFFQ